MAYLTPGTASVMSASSRATMGRCSGLTSAIHFRTAAWPSALSGRGAPLIRVDARFVVRFAVFLALFFAFFGLFFTATTGHHGGRRKSSRCPHRLGKDRWGKEREGEGG